MRTKAKRLKIRRLFVLGAGASYASTLSPTGPPAKKLLHTSTAPLDKDFCQSILEEDYRTPKWWRATVDEIYSKWKDKQPLASYGLEEAILRQLGYLEYFEAIEPRRARAGMSPHDFLSRMAHLVAYRLKKCRENRRELYQKLAKSLELEGDTPDRVITFNYDVLLDQRLLSMGFTPQQLYFDKIQNSKNALIKPGTKQGRPMLLKLHGSLNWRVLDGEISRLLEGASEPERLESVWFSKSRSTPAFGDDDAPCIVPPLPVKPISSIYLFRYLWTRAAEYLKEAEELIICGYSLPEADRMAVSLFGSFGSNRLKRIIVADPDSRILTKWRTVLDRPGLPKKVSWEWAPGFEECIDRIALSKRTGS